MGKQKNLPAGRLGKFDQHVGTKLGIIVLVIIAITAGAFVWMLIKDGEVGEAPQEVAVQPKVGEKGQKQQNQTKTQETTQNDKASNTAAEVTQPKMPTITDEAGKSPEQMVKDFYEWYITSTNYNYYHIYKLNENKYPININDLILKSPFISSTYEQNMKKTNGGDPILCSQEPDNNKFKGVKDPVISGNNAKMYARIEYASNPDINFEIQVMLKKEKKQWKIDEINCSQFHL